MSKSTDRRSVVSVREPDAYKLPIELLAATLAVQTFLKHKTRLSVLLRLDNTSAVAYINNLGGTVSPELVYLAKTLWMWCLERTIHITAQHLPGAQNHIADAESRTMVDRSDWKLNPILFKRIVNLFGPIEVDLFASRLTAQCPVYFSWRPDPYAAATDAFLQDWSQIRGYANPPWSLIGRVLSQVQVQQAYIILVAPVWKTQPWYPLYTSRYAEGIPLSDQTPSDNAQSRLGESVPTASRVAYLRERYREHELSEEATSLLLKSWRTKTNRSYDSLFRKWHSWCHSRGSDPFSGLVKEVLANLHDEGYIYRSLNSYRSAISSVHERVDGCPVGQHPLVIRLMKGVFNDRPPLPRYTSTWNVQMVLSYIGSLGSNGSLSLKQLSLETAMLLALTRPSRSADLSQLDIKGRQYKPDGVVFLPTGLAKQSQQGKPVATFFYPSFPSNSLLYMPCYNS